MDKDPNSPEGVESREGASEAAVRKALAGEMNPQLGTAGSPGDSTAAHDPDRTARKERPPAKPYRRRVRDPALARAFRTGRPVEGKVEQVIRGGYEVRVGRTRCFCPYSQMALERVQNPEEHVGQVYLYRVIQFRRGGEDVVLSRRAVLEEERLEEAKAVRAALVEGAVTQGRIASVTDFGAFVDLGAGVMGLVHVSELSTSRVDRVADAVGVGDLVQVRILKLDDKSGRLSLSIRQLKENPWADVPKRIQVGQVHPGTVVRLAEFGAFVERSPGVEALAPAREFPPSAKGWQHGLEPGHRREWLVLSLQPDHQRMSVAPVPEGQLGLPSQVEPGARLKGKVQRVEKYGVFVWLGPGQMGLVPNAWTGTPRGADLTRYFSPGKEVSVEVVEVGANGRRIRLAMKRPPSKRATSVPGRKTAGLPKRPRELPRPARGKEGLPPAPSPASFGTSLGDVLKAAIEKKNHKT